LRKPVYYACTGLPASGEYLKNMDIPDLVWPYLLYVPYKVLRPNHFCRFGNGRLWIQAGRERGRGGQRGRAGAGAANQGRSGHHPGQPDAVRLDDGGDQLFLRRRSL